MLFCSHCGIMVGEEYDLCPKCDGSLAPSASGDELGQYAGLWIRLAAGLIDALILGVALLMEFAFASLMGMGQDDGWVGIGVFWGAFALVCLSYEVGMTRSRRRGTLGKRALGLMVTDRSGDRISLGRSISRAVAKLLLSALSFTVVAFRRRKTALHDQIARTEVARGPRSSSMAAWSMAMGLLSLLLSVPAGIPAIIMGHISRARLRKSGGGLQGDGEARAGLILGYASIAIFPLLFAVPQFVKMQAAAEADPVGEMRVLNTA